MSDVKVTTVQLSESTLTAVVTLSDNSQHVLGFDDVDLAAPDIIRDSENGTLAEYLLGVDDMFKDTQDEIDEAFSDADDFTVIYKAA